MNNKINVVEIVSALFSSYLGSIGIFFPFIFPMVIFKNLNLKGYHKSNETALTNLI